MAPAGLGRFLGMSAAFSRAGPGFRPDRDLWCSCSKYTVICGLVAARMYSDLRSSEVICGLFNTRI